MLNAITATAATTARTVVSTMKTADKLSRIPTAIKIAVPAAAGAGIAFGTGCVTNAICKHNNGQNIFGKKKEIKERRKNKKENSDVENSASEVTEQTESEAETESEEVEVINTEDSNSQPNEAGCKACDVDHTLEEEKLNV